MSRITLLRAPGKVLTKRYYRTINGHIRKRGYYYSRVSGVEVGRKGERR